MSDIQTDKKRPHHKEVSDTTLREPRRPKKPKKPKNGSRSKVQSNHDYYEERKKSEKGVHMWLPMGSAENLDQIQDWIAAGRSGDFSRGSLVALLADEITGERRDKLSLLHPGEEKDVVLSTAIAKGLDLLIAEKMKEAARRSALACSEIETEVDLGLCVDSDADALRGANSGSAEAGPNAIAEESLAAAASIGSEFDSIFADSTSPQDAIDGAKEAIRP